jgi:hypothetical protein
MLKHVAKLENKVLMKLATCGVCINNCCVHDSYYAPILQPYVPYYSLSQLQLGVSARRAVCCTILKLQCKETVNSY